MHNFTKRELDNLSSLETWVSQNNLTYSFEEKHEVNWWLFIYPPEALLDFNPEIAISFQNKKYYLFIRYSAGPILTWQQAAFWEFFELKTITDKISEHVKQAVKVGSNG